MNNDILTLLATIGTGAFTTFVAFATRFLHIHTKIKIQELSKILAETSTILSDMQTTGVDAKVLTEQVSKTDEAIANLIVPIINGTEGFTI